METGTIIAISVVVISVVGWGVNHFFTIRAHKKSFLNEVLNNARLETTKAIRDYESWLTTINAKISDLSSNVIEAGGFHRTVNWTGVSDEFRQLLYGGDHSLRWIFCLEEYEILFPKTASLRKELSDRHSKMMEYLSSVATELISISPPSTPLEKRKEVVEKVQKEHGLICDQQALMEDLRIYLQNFCLGHITGSRVPERQPKGPLIPRIIQGENKNLRIVSGKDSNAKK